MSIACVQEQAFPAHSQNIIVIDEVSYEINRQIVL